MSCLAEAQRLHLTCQVGTELRGIQLHELDAKSIDELAQLVAERGVVVVRGQSMQLQQQLDVGRRLGRLHVHPVYCDREPKEALRIHADERSDYVAGDEWHSDVSWDVEPPGLSLLRLERTPAVGGDTLFASSDAAHAALSSPMQSFLADLSAVHIYRITPSGTPIQNVHPVVRTHPRTGRRCLYVNRSFTDHIEGVTRCESDVLLEFLYRHITGHPEYQCRVRWEPRTVTIWDNRCTQHVAVWDYFPGVRSGWRVSVCGERPYLAV